MSNEIGKELAAALVALGAEIENVTKDRANPFYKSTYATLGAIIDASRPLLAKHGLVVSQTTGVTDGTLLVRTMVIHKSGQFIDGFYPLKPVKDDPQGYGSAMTYARRYCMAAILGITQEDDDGNHASHGHKAAPERQSTPPSRQTPDKAPATSAKASAGTPVTCGFADKKPVRKVPADMTITELNKAKELAEQVLDDPSKEKWHAQANAAIDAVNDELASRINTDTGREPPF